MRACSDSTKWWKQPRRPVCQSEGAFTVDHTHSWDEWNYCLFIQRVSFFPHSYVSCVLGCPYEGSVAPEKVAHVSGATDCRRCSSWWKVPTSVCHHAGCQASALHGLLRDLPGRHHRSGDSWQHESNAGLSHPGGSGQRPGGALPRYLRPGPR